MSKGNPKVVLRLTPELLAQVHSAIERNNLTRTDEPYDVSEWIRQAIRERLDKQERSRKGKR